MWNKNQEESYEHLSVLQPIGQYVNSDLFPKLIANDA